jgi:surface carbohydrate biosynthesis protein
MIFFKAILHIVRTKFVWKVDKNRSIVILSDLGSEFIIPCLGGRDYFLIDDRRVVYIKYLLVAVIFNLTKGFDSIIDCYYLSIIRRLNPLLVVTFVDNRPLYWRLNQQSSKKIKWLTIQNGTHHLNNNLDIPAQYMHFFLKKGAYYSNLACISQYEIDYYEKNKDVINVENFYPIGTLKSSGYTASYKRKQKIFDVCIVVNSNNHREGNMIIWGLIKKYIQKYDNTTLCVALKKNHSSETFIPHMKGIYDTFIGTTAVFVHQIENSSYYMSDISKVTIGFSSTILRETFSRGNKIYPLNFVGEDFDSPYDLLGYALDPSYNEFETHLQNLLSANEDEYCRANKDLMKYLCLFDVKESPSKKLEGIISSLLPKEG